jgi:hypothetical protein
MKIEFTTIELKVNGKMEKYPVFYNEQDLYTEILIVTDPRTVDLNVKNFNVTITITENTQSYGVVNTTYTTLNQVCLITVSIISDNEIKKVQLIVNENIKFNKHLKSQYPLINIMEDEIEQAIKLCKARDNIDRIVIGVESGWKLRIKAPYNHFNN